MKRLAVLAVPFLLLSCQNAPRAVSAAAATPRKVILLSLDGAGAQVLQQLHKDGALSAGGFESFFRDGQVADRMLPVNPTLTSVNHISLATGYPPAQTGIVSNLFHRAGTPFLDTVSGFAAPIETETLWESAMRQGKKVGVVTWPGVDAKIPRRTADWGMIWLSDPESEPAVVTLKRSNWRPGEWVHLPCQAPRTDSLCWAKVLSLDPGSDTAQVYINALYGNSAYPKTFETALGKEGLPWPGPPDSHYLKEAWAGRPGIDLATWTEQAERFTAYFGAALRLAAGRSDWNLILGYIPVIDEAGHELLLTDPAQPGYTPERRDALAATRLKVWQAVDRELKSFLASVDLKTTAVIVVSDHGMAPIHTGIDPNVLLRDKGLLTAGADGKILEGTRVYAVSDGGISEIYVDPAAPDRERLIRDARGIFSTWSEGGKHLITQVLTRHEGAVLGIDHPNSGDLILFAPDGYSFTNKGLKSGHALAPTEVYGMHGYPNSDLRMASIYMAIGAGVKPGKPGAAGVVRVVRNIDVAGQVSGWLGIEKPRAKTE